MSHTSQIIRSFGRVTRMNTSHTCVFLCVFKIHMYETCHDVYMCISNTQKIHMYERCTCMRGIHVWDVFMRVWNTHEWDVPRWTLKYTWMIHIPVTLCWQIIHSLVWWWNTHECVRSVSFICVLSCIITHLFREKSISLSHMWMNDLPTHRDWNMTQQCV